jgi:hypothetical protein
MGRIGALGLLAALLSAGAATATGTPAAPGSSKAGVPAKAGPVTDANVAERVRTAYTRADQAALGAYYKAKAAAEAARIAHFDQLFRAYMKVEGKEAQPLQRHARALLKAARLSQQQYALLAQAHLNISWKE